MPYKYLDTVRGALSEVIECPVLEINGDMLLDRDFDLDSVTFVHFLAGGQVADGHLPRSHPNNINFSITGDQRSYHTGNLGKIPEGGNLTILGRIDRQIKLNDYRIELGEIEQCALQVAGVTEAVVVSKPSRQILWFWSSAEAPCRSSRRRKSGLISKPTCRPICAPAVSRSARTSRCRYPERSIGQR